jgi:hypothetical protein
MSQYDGDDDDVIVDWSFIQAQPGWSVVLKDGKEWPIVGWAVADAYSPVAITPWGWVPEGNIQDLKWPGGQARWEEMKSE